MENIKDILEKALTIGNKTSFKVRFFIGKKFIETKEMTYTELGMTLINNCNDINYVYIYQRE